MDTAESLNEFGQPIGPSLGPWTPPSAPTRTPLIGTNVRLEPLDHEQHTAPLFEQLTAAPESLWTYLPYGPFDESAELGQLLDSISKQTPGGASDWQPYAVIVDQVVLGFLAYLRIKPNAGSIEIGGITFSPGLQRTTAASEALFLMIKNVFDLGYRRCEWKCDHLNEPSGKAALRYGFEYEGTFRKATHYKGRSRDTAWYAITEDDWPIVGAAFESWLNPKNFSSDGTQIETLAILRANMMA